VEAELLERRLRRWGANVTRVEAAEALSAVTHQQWQAVLVDHAVGTTAAVAIAAAASAVPRRIVLVTPSGRPKLPALKDAGFSGYLVKPIRAASLLAQLTAPDAAGLADEPKREDARSVPDVQRALAVLVAEDNEINALLTRTLLTRLGHRVTMAT